MYTHEYEKMYKLEDSYWWFVGRKYVIRNILHLVYGSRKGLNILDAGCGTGSILLLLKEFGSVLGVDLSESALSYCRKRGIEQLLRASADDLKTVPADKYDVVTALDIIEHIEDDSKALLEFNRVCKSGGYVLITVPAYNFLWSNHDIALSHRRRYNRKELEEKVSKAGFKTVKTTYFITFLLPVIFIFRIFQKMFQKNKIPDTAYIMPPVFLNVIFIMILRIEANLIRFLNLPAGVSLICIAEKE